jgi:hypothetical protein
MGVSSFVQPDFTAQSATAYKNNLDAAAAVFKRLSAAFAPHEQATPNMTVRLDAGAIFDGLTLTEVAAQNTGTITAPTTNPRKDIVHVDRITGAVGVATGAEAASPTDPAIPAGKLPVARINLTTSTTTIANSILDDLRAPADMSRPKTLVKTTDYTLALADYQARIIYDTANNRILSLPAAATAGDGFWFLFYNHGSGVITVNPNGIEKLDNSSGKNYVKQTAALIYCDGTEWRTWGGLALIQGKRAIPLKASAWRPQGVNGCAALATTNAITTGRPDITGLAFDSAAQEAAQLDFTPPPSYDGQAITFRYQWAPLSTNTGGVTFGLQAVFIGDDDAIDTAFGTAQIVSDTRLAQKDLHTSAVSAAITPAGVWANGKRIYLRLYRDVADAGDTLAEDAVILEVQLFWTLNKGNDA